MDKLEFELMTGEQKAIYWKQELEVARYQIECAIARIETIHIEDLQEPSASLLDTVVAQLEKYLKANNNV